MGPVPPSPPTVLAAMRLEALALGGRVVRTGMGHHRAQAKATEVAATLAPGSPVVLAGISGGLDPALAPGTMVVATAVRDPDEAVLDLGAEDAATVAEGLRRTGRAVHLGPVVSSTTLVHGVRRTELARTGALAVDMESAWVARAMAGHRLVVVRVVADTAGNVALGLVRGLAALRGVRSAFDPWPSSTA